jgi:hypothetical protein
MAPVSPSSSNNPSGDQIAQLVARLNREYAVVLAGEAPMVLRESLDADGLPVTSFLTVNGFTQWMRPHRLWIPRPDGGVRALPVAKAWLESQQRRQYDGVVFDPSGRALTTHYNFWRGFAVEPSGSGSCERFLEHLAENVCAGDSELLAWILGWFAAIVQRPAAKTGTALVLRGGQGVGKTVVGQTFGSLLGPHYLLVSEGRYVTGRFNAHLARCLLLQLDEATWAGDHAAAGRLKDLITGDWQFIEYKGKEAIQVRNHVRLLVTTNQDWAVPAGIDERRFCVLDVAEAKRQDHDYFHRIEEEMQAGGRAKLLHDLLRLDLSGLSLRTVPRTAALAEQTVVSLSPEQQWWFDVVQSGQLPGDAEGTGEVECERLYAHYVARLTKMGVPRRRSETAFGIALRRLVPGVDRERPTRGDGGRRYVYRFPPLAICREVLTRAMGERITSTEASSWMPSVGVGPDVIGANAAEETFS